MYILTLSFMAAEIEELLCISGKWPHLNSGKHFSMSWFVEFNWRLVFCYGKCIIVKAGGFVFVFFVCLLDFVFFFLPPWIPAVLSLLRGRFFFSWKNQSEFCSAKQRKFYTEEQFCRVSALRITCVFLLHNMYCLVAVPCSKGNSANVLLCAII